MEQQLVSFLQRVMPDAASVTVSGFAPIPGGFSRETFRFDAVVEEAYIERVPRQLLARPIFPRELQPRRVRQ